MPLFGRIAQYSRSTTPYSGLVESTVTSNVFLTVDAVMVNYSWITSSATASRLTVQGNESDGLNAGLNESEWLDMKGVTATGYYSMTTIPRWLRMLRTPSNSSSTIFLSLHFGP